MRIISYITKIYYGYNKSFAPLHYLTMTHMHSIDTAIEQLIYIHVLKHRQGRGKDIEVDPQDLAQQGTAAISCLSCSSNL